MQVLLAEAEAPHDAQLVRQFEASGWSCACVATPTELFTALSTRTYDLTVINLAFGGLGDALAAVESVANASPSTFIVALTGAADAELLVSALNRGADIVLEKPVSAAAIISCWTIDEGVRRPLSLFDVERKYVRRVINSCNGNKSRAARILGLTRQGLHAKLYKHSGP